MVGSGKAAKNASKVKILNTDKVKRKRRRRKKEGKLCHLYPQVEALDAPRHRHRLEGHVDHEPLREEHIRVHHDEFESIGAL